MSIEIGSKWVKDGEVVEVSNIVHTPCVKGSPIYIDTIVYHRQLEDFRAREREEFLEQYKPYEVVYEYKWVQIRSGNAYETEGYYTEAHEIADKEVDFWNSCLVAPLLKTKRERK